jgi:hypothetical protein
MKAHLTAVPEHACDTARRRASLALDGELDELALAQLRRHLASCPGCARVTAGMEAASDLIRRSPLEPFSCRVRGAHALRTCSSSGARHWAGAGVAVMALVLVIGSLPGVERGPRSPETVVTRPAVAPLELPIGQRSAMDDFTADPSQAPDAALDRRG